MNSDDVVAIPRKEYENFVLYYKELLNFGNKMSDILNYLKTMLKEYDNGADNLKQSLPTDTTVEYAAYMLGYTSGIKSVTNSTMAVLSAYK